jgi:hypothetical protein
MAYDTKKQVVVPKTSPIEKAKPREKKKPEPIKFY